MHADAGPGDGDFFDEKFRFIEEANSQEGIEKHPVAAIAVMLRDIIMAEFVKENKRETQER